MKTTRRKPISVSCLQIKRGWRYLTGSDIPGDLRFDRAASRLIEEYGRLRVQMILMAIPNDPEMTEAAAYAAAQKADPGA